MQIKIKRLHENAVLPVRSSDTSMCFNITAASMQESPVSVTCGSGWQFNLPDDVWAEVHAMPDLWKTGLVFCNGCDILDSTCTDELKMHFYKVYAGVPYGTGSVFARLIFHNFHSIKPEEVTFDVQ